MDVFEASAAATGAKDEKGEGEGEIEEKGKPKELAADSQMVRADAEEIDDYKSRNGAARKVAADSVIAEIQCEADRAATGGKMPSTPGMASELPPIGAV